MAIVNIGAAGTHTFASTDTVTFTATHTQGNGNSVTKTDALAMDINMASGVIITVSGTGYIDIQGSRGKFVHFKSNAAEPRMGDWGHFTFTGTSTSNTIRWAIASNANYGVLVFQGHSPSSGKFEYIIQHNMKIGGLYTTTTTGTTNWSDMACIRCTLVTHTGATVMNADRITFLRNVASGILANAKETGTWQDISYGETSSLTTNFLVRSGKTITVNRLYSIYKSSRANQRFSYGDAGTVNINDSIFDGGDIPIIKLGAGASTITNCDITNGLNAFQGMYKGAGTLTAVSCYLAGTYGYDMSVFDTSTTTPTAKQHFGLDTITTPKSTRNFTHDFSSVSESVATAELLAVTCTPGCVSRVKVIVTETSGDYSTLAGSTEFDAPDVYISEIDQTIPCHVTDWGESGAKYNSSARTINVKIPAGDYYYTIVGEDVHGNVFKHAEQGPVTVTAAASGGGLMVAAGMAGGMRG